MNHYAFVKIGHSNVRADLIESYTESRDTGRATLLDGSLVPMRGLVIRTVSGAEYVSSERVEQFEARLRTALLGPQSEEGVA